jgi:hypothetical protein
LGIESLAKAVDLVACRFRAYREDGGAAADVEALRIVNARIVHEASGTVLRGINDGYIRHRRR